MSVPCGKCGTEVNVLGRATDGTLHPGKVCSPLSQAIETLQIAETQLRDLKAGYLEEELFEPIKKTLCRIRETIAKCEAAATQDAFTSAVVEKARSAE